MPGERSGTFGCATETAEGGVFVRGGGGYVALGGSTWMMTLRKQLYSPVSFFSPVPASSPTPASGVEGASSDIWHSPPLLC